MLVRQRLVERIRGHAGPVMIEAGAGAGKSVVIDQIVRGEADRWLVVEGGSSTTAAVLDDVPHGLGVIVDDVHLLDPCDVDRLARVLPETMPIIVAGRILPPSIVAAGRQRSPLELDAEALFFDREEIVQLVGDPAAAAAVARLTSGWPVAVGTMLERRDPGAEPGPQLARQTNVVDDLIGAELAAIAPAERLPIAQLCFCRDFTSTLARRLDPQLLDRMKRAGLPLFRLAPDRYEIPLPVRHALRRQIDIETDQLEPVVDGLVAEGLFEAALDVCAQRGWTARAAALLTELDPDQLYSFDASTVPNLLNVLGSDLHDHPGAMLSVARIQFMDGEIEDVRRSLTTALDRLAITDPDATDPVQHEVLAELAYLEYESSDLDRAIEYRDRCRSVIDPDGRGAANARLNETTAGLLASGKGRDDLLQARDLLVDAMSIWNQLGFVTRAGMTLRMMVSLVLFELGRFAEANDLLVRALRTGGTTAVETAMNQLFRANALGWLGRVDDARQALDEAQQLADSLDLTWVRGYVAWVDAINGSYEDDGERVARSLRRAEQLFGELTAGSTGAVFRCESALALARCQRGSAAASQLDAARNLDGIDDADLARAEAGVAAHTADPETGLRAIAQWRASHPLSPVDQWRATLWQAACAARLDRYDEAADLLVEARTAASAIGEPDLAEHTEGRLLASITDRLTAASSEPVGYRIQLFGPFKVVRDGVDCRLAKGHGQTIVKLLTLSGGGRLHIDEIIDALWPAADTSLGRRRLRNVLQRLRATCGPLVLREGDFLSIDAAAESDYRQVIAWRHELVKNEDSPTAALSALASTLELEFLEGDRFEPWAELPRASMTNGRLQVLDRLVEVAIADGQLDAAGRAAVDAVTIDPYEQRRIDRMAAAFDRCDRADLASAVRQAAASAQLS